MKRFTRIVAAVFAVMVTVSATLPALPASAVSSSSLSIVPKKNYVIKPGKSVDDKLLIRNLDKVAPLELTLRVVDFTFSDDGGTPKLFLAQDAPQTTWSLKPFLSVPQNVTIEPNSSKSIKMNVSIPKGQGAGSFYSAIVYSSGPSEGGNVGLSASGVTLVFTDIPGKVKEDLKLEKLGAYFRASQAKSAGYVYFTAHEPDTIAYTLTNNGNVTEAPAGTITVTDLFGHSYKITNVNPGDSLALRGQTRTFLSCIKLKSQNVDFEGSKAEASTCTSPGLWPGYYSVSLDLFYGQNGNLTQEITGKASFWYLPTWFIVLLIIVLVIATYYIRKLVIKIRTLLYGPQGKSRAKATRHRK